MNDDVAKKIAAFFNNHPQRHIAKGHLLALAGDNPPGVWYLESGEVRQYGISPTGDHLVVNTFKPPAFFPMSWAINNTPNEYFFDAITDAVVRVAPPAAVVQFVRDNPDVLFNLLARVYRGTDGLLSRMLQLMQNSARNRIANELLIICRRTGASADGVYHLLLHETDIASRVGLSRETVNREMRALKALKIITVTQSGITVKNLEALQAMLEPETA